MQHPLFLQKTKRIVETMKGLSLFELESLLDISPERAFDIYNYYHHFDSMPAYPAITSYYGAAFRNIAPDDFSKKEFDFAENHIRILSALYGMLRTSDGIKPYRLGISKNFSVDEKNIYDYWDRDIYNALFQSGEPVVNLTSMDYSKFYLPYLKENDRVITCKFMVKKQGAPPRGTVSTVRTARGQMARFIIKNHIVNPEDIKHFNWSGYRYSEENSTVKLYTFIADRSLL